MILGTAIIMLAIQRGNNKKETINRKESKYMIDVTKVPDTSFQRSASA